MFHNGIFVVPGLLTVDVVRNDLSETIVKMYVGQHHFGPKRL